MPDVCSYSGRLTEQTQSRSVNVQYQPTCIHSDVIDAHATYSLGDIATCLSGPYLHRSTVRVLSTHRVLVLYVPLHTYVRT